MSAPSYAELLRRLLAVRWRLRRRGFAESAAASLEAPTGKPWQHGELTVQRLRKLARWLPGSTCLHRSMGLIDAAVARGLDARLVLGVQRFQGTSRAHAWVQMGEQCLGETQREGVDYRPLPTPEIDR